MAAIIGGAAINCDREMRSRKKARVCGLLGGVDGAPAGIAAGEG